VLFESIDRNKDGRLNKDELQTAFQRAGLSVSRARLAGFFEEIDMNRDGFITFDEWRYVHACLSAASFRGGVAGLVFGVLPRG
jgi:Ca2+-binding EF-hand superfamily protein